MNFLCRRTGVSVLVVTVCLLVLLPLAPASSTSPMSSNSHSWRWSSNSHSWGSHSWSSGWNPSFTYSHWDSSWHPSFSYSNTWHGSWTGTWQPSWSHTWSNTWSHTWWSNTWSNTWSRTWSNTWSHTWNSQYYPSYTWYPPWTQYAPPPGPVPGCYPYSPYCNGYYSSGYAQITLSPIPGQPGGQVSFQGYGFLPTDTNCSLSSPYTPNLILTGTAACVIQSGTGIANGGFIIGNVPPGQYVVQVTGNQGDFAQVIFLVA